MERVLEIGGVAAGYCGRMFVRAGADVVRVESSVRDPAWVSDEAMDVYLHSGKRSVGQMSPSLLRELAAAADVVVCEASNADAVDALGFDSWPTPLKLAITPFGRTGPKRNWQASANVILAMGGYTQLMGDPDRAPLSLPGHYVEFQTATLGYMALNACRFEGQGNTIDLAMLEALMALSQFTTVRWHCTSEVRSRHGSDFWFVVPSNLFACRDGWVYINIVPNFWDPFTVFINRPELLMDSRFADNDLRMQNRDVLHAITAAALADLSKQELLARAEECRIRDFFEQIQDSEGVTWRSPALPFQINRESRRTWTVPVRAIQPGDIW
jgi:crotonobetainyl-CoA:carnitine CoA-transferase CaiB-like acyl-CoA transferase